MKKMISFICILMLFTISSCGIFMNYGENDPNKYEDKIPYIYTEKVDGGKINNISVDEYAIKMDRKDTFICFYHTSSCSACKGAMERYISPYVKETNNVIYSIDVYSEENVNNLEKLKSYQPIDSTYVRQDEAGRWIVSRPLIQIVYEGEVIVYEKGLSINLIYMLKGYVL